MITIGNDVLCFDPQYRPTGKGMSCFFLTVYCISIRPEIPNLKMPAFDGSITMSSQCSMAKSQCFTVFNGYPPVIKRGTWKIPYQLWNLIAGNISELHLGVSSQPWSWLLANNPISATSHVPIDGFPGAIRPLLRHMVRRIPWIVCSVSGLVISSVGFDDSNEWIWRDNNGNFPN